MELNIIGEIMFRIVFDELGFFTVFSGVEFAAKFSLHSVD